MRLIAHRGASGTCPENTLAAFRRALELGAKALEFDVQQSKDGELVVVHDGDLKRVAGVAREPRELSRFELARLDAGSWFGPGFAGERIPTLAQVLDLAGPPVELHLEIKQADPPYAGIEGRVLGELRARPGLLARTVISSFDHPTLRRLRELDSGLRLGYLAGRTPRPRALAQALELRCESVHISLRQAGPQWVEGARRRSLKVLVYTVNSPAELRRLSALGVDGVFTNYPDMREEGDGRKGLRAADARSARG